MDQEKYVSICSCEEKDWECDYGFHHEKLAGACLPIDPSFEIVDKKPENCFGWYSVTTGYRKVPGNMCQGGNFL